MQLYQEEEPHGAPTWVVTFADLMSLLLTFFVLMLSFSTTEVVKFRQAMSSVEEAFGLRSPEDVSDSPQGHLAIDDTRAGITPAEVEAQIEELLEATGLQARAEAHMTADGVMLRVEGDMMFDSGEAELSPGIFALLNDLAKYIKAGDHRVAVVGHTDDTPIATLVYPSNWELSAARAAQAVRYLVEQGVPAERLRAIGQADTFPLASNGDLGGKARNRRIEFVFSAQEVEGLRSISVGDGVENAEPPVR
jgi:chemotaxis protein MotB